MYNLPMADFMGNYISQTFIALIEQK